MTSKQKLLILIAFLIILDIIIWFATRPPVYYNDVVLSEVNNIKNETEMKYMDTVISVGLDKENISGVSVIIKNLSEPVKEKFHVESGLDLQAAIIGNETQFILYVTDMGRKACIIPLAHELVHLHQYNSGEFKILTPKSIRWKGVELSDSVVVSIPYQEREWEKIAFQMESSLGKLIEKELY